METYHYENRIKFGTPCRFFRDGKPISESEYKRQLIIARRFGNVEGENENCIVTIQGGMF